MAKRSRQKIQKRTRKDAQSARSYLYEYVHGKGSYFLVINEENRVIAQGSHETMKKHHPDAKLLPPFPAPPSRLPKHAVECYDDGKFVLSSSFFGIYAAAHFLDAIIDDAKVKWRNPQELTFDIGDRRIVLKGDTLEEIIDHKLTPIEKAWELPTPVAEQAEAFRKGVKVNLTPNSSNEQPRGSSVRAQRSERPPSKPRTSIPDGFIGIGDIVASLGIEPRIARGILRKHETKPEHGWAWSKKDAERITKLLKANV